MKIAAVLCLILSGCASGVAPLAQAPVDSMTLRGAHAALANCAYQRLDRSEGTGIKKIDMPSETRLALESGGVRHWQLIFKQDGSVTRIHFTRAQTMWGPLGGSEKILDELIQCG